MSSYAARRCIIFLLTRLLRGATRLVRNLDDLPPDFYSHASCEARLNSLNRLPVVLAISTHTPLARRDAYGYDCCCY